MKTFLKSVALMAFLVCGGFGECAQEDTAALVMSGYTMLSPPSNLFAPGAVVMMMQDAHGHAQLKLLCGPRANLGLAFSPRVSDTMSSSLKLSRKQQMTLEADAVDKFKSRTQVEDVRAVTVTFTNPKLLEVSEEEIYDNIDNRTEACSKAIDARIASGYSPVFVTSAYVADVEYIVNFKSDAQLSKTVRQQKMGKIAASLGGGHTEIGEHSLKATNLILALRADAFLMQITPQDRDKAANMASHRGIKEPYAEALQGAEAPLIIPEGSWVSPIRTNK